LTSQNPIPEVAAVIVSQVLVIDAVTGLKTLVNIFSNLQTPVLPMATSIGLFVKMVDGEGTYKLRIRFVRLRDDKIVRGFQSRSLLGGTASNHLKLGSISSKCR